MFSLLVLDRVCNLNFSAPFMIAAIMDVGLNTEFAPGVSFLAAFTFDYEPGLDSRLNPVAPIFVLLVTHTSEISGSIVWFLFDFFDAD